MPGVMVFVGPALANEMRLQGYEQQFMAHVAAAVSHGLNQLVGRETDLDSEDYVAPDDVVVHILHPYASYNAAALEIWALCWSGDGDPAAQMRASAAYLHRTLQPWMQEYFKPGWDYVWVIKGKTGSACLVPTVEP
jgi:hypothetical protein